MSNDENVKEVINEIKFHYIKSSDYREIFASGVFGGITPQGLIHMSFFLERFPIPKVLHQEVSANGKLGKEISRESVDGVIRHVQAGIAVDTETAKSMIKWLQDKIDEMENQSSSVNISTERPN